MKNILLFTFFLLLSGVTLAQGPNKFHYQAVARDQSGTVITGDISIRISLLEDGANGATRYSEIHEVATNPQGVFNLNIGDGRVVSGNMDLIIGQIMNTG